MLQLGWDAPDQQIRIDTRGGRFYVDFDLEPFNAWGEFDGEGKYRDKRMRSPGKTLEDVLLDEKRREDLIRAATHRRIIRWGWQEVRTLSAFRAFIRSLPRENT